MNDRRDTPVPIYDIRQIDLMAHGIVEASAGTGKTHTIEHLVVELLKSGSVQSLDEILVVTFTEKAVSELKYRIRNIIHTTLEKEPSVILSSSFENFDSASIYTIHGFCNKILNDYAFENRKHLRNALVDDRRVYEHVLSHLKREVWPDQYGEHLCDVLQLSGYPGTTGSGVSSWEEQVIDLSLRYQASGYDRINPPEGADILQQFLAINKQVTLNLDKLSSLAGSIDEDDYTKSQLYMHYGSLNINKNSIKKRLKTCIQLLRILSCYRKKALSLNSVADFIIKLDYGETGFNTWTTGWNKSQPDYQEKMPYLPDLIFVLENLRAIDFNRFRSMLAVHTILSLKHNGLQYKSENSLISYDDMVIYVNNALMDPSSPLKTLLRKRYRYALVDEFQDTDMLQWTIFQTVFLNSEHNILFIIGDPKQAIYGFRGADIHAYYTARDQMISEYNARYYSLSDNWRSSPSLIRAFNGIFSDGNWFSDNTLMYVPSSFPEKKDPALFKDPYSLVIVDCGSSSGTDARIAFSGYIASEVSQLISDNPGLDPSSISILISKWKEADAIEKALKQAGVKYSYYKKEGLYQTREALEISYILSSIADTHDPGKKKLALATRFFNIDVLSLFHFDGIPGDHPAFALIEKWKLLSDQKKWRGLFQSLLEETGILFRMDNDDTSRQIINYKSIIQALEIEAYRNNYSIHDLTLYMKRLRLNTADHADSSNIQKIDLEQPGVQILTMHASKGLEFDIVFIAGGFTRRDRSNYLTYHDRNRRVFDLIKDENSNQLHETERIHEEERLYYVAITRARNRVYIPVFQPTSRSLYSAGILGRKMPAALASIQGEIGISNSTSIEYHPSQPASGSTPVIDDTPIDIPHPLLPDIDLHFFNRSLTIDSFSGLKEKIQTSNAPIERNASFGQVASTEMNDESIPAEDLIIVPSEGVGELPHGIQTGLMVHEILEKIDFSEIKSMLSFQEILSPDSSSYSLIYSSYLSNMQDTCIDSDSLLTETSRMIWNALHAPIDSTGLVLCNINKKIHEVEFYYPLRHCHEGDMLSPFFSDGFIHGFIDMIFEHKDRFYIVDWKSNYISAGYSRALLEKNIVEMHYDLQIKIYTGALIRWLKTYIPDYSYNSHFGGVYYLYLRGMDYEKPGNGIFFYRPEREPEEFISE